MYKINEVESFIKKLKCSRLFWLVKTYGWFVMGYSYLHSSVRQLANK